MNIGWTEIFVSGARSINRHRKRSWYSPLAPNAKDVATAMSLILARSKA